MKELSHKLGAGFDEKDDLGVRHLLGDFNLFRIGGSRKITNLISKESEDLKWYVFDYKYIVSTGNSAQQFKQTVFFINSKKLGLPEFLMKPEGFFHRIGKWLGIEDIDFDSFPRFSDNYFLKGEYESFIRETFNNHILRLFCIEKDWWMEGMGYYLIIYKKRKILPPAEIKRFHKKALFLFDKMKHENDVYLNEKESPS